MLFFVSRSRLLFLIYINLGSLVLSQDEPLDPYEPDSMVPDTLGYSSAAGHRSIRGGLSTCEDEIANIFQLNPPEEDTCSKIKQKTAGSLHQQSLCREPRKVMVPLGVQRSDGSKLYMPSFVEVERCVGFCSSRNHQCIPSEMEIIEIPVIERNLAHLGGRMRPKPKCWRYKVEKHLKCECGCKLNANQCNEKQSFDEKLCTCVCRDHKQTSEHCREAMKMFNSRTCECDCPPSGRNCSTGAIFNPESCQCETNGFEDELP